MTRVPEAYVATRRKSVEWPYYNRSTIVYFIWVQYNTPHEWLYVIVFFMSWSEGFVFMESYDMINIVAMVFVEYLFAGKHSTSNDDCITYEMQRLTFCNFVQVIQVVSRSLFRVLREDTGGKKYDRPQRTKVITSTIKCGMKSCIHSPTSTVQPLKLGNVVVLLTAMASTFRFLYLFALDSFNSPPDSYLCFPVWHSSQAISSWPKIAGILQTTIFFNNST